jgi:hypothetical protein
MYMGSLWHDFTNIQLRSASPCHPRSPAASGSGAAKIRVAQKCIRVACGTQPWRRAVSKVAKALEPSKPAGEGKNGGIL